MLSSFDKFLYLLKVNLDSYKSVWKWLYIPVEEIHSFI